MIRRASTAVLLVLLGATARADDHPIATLVPDHVFMVRGLSLRNGDWVALEPSFWFTRDLVRPGRPMVFIARAMVGVGGSGGGIGFGTTWDPPCPTAEACKTTPFFWVPVSFEAHVERMYGPTHWRSATYLGPHLSLSGYLLKASVGWMIDARDRSDSHLQAAIGFGF